MAIEGSLQIQLHCEERQVQRVAIQSTRPLAAVNIFHGKRVDDVLQTLPLLYHVCGIAQASAAVSACEQAMAIAVPDALRDARDMLVWLETAREHCWRILIDWAGMLGEAKDGAAIAQIQQGIPALQQALFADGKAFQLNTDIEVKADKVQAIIHQLETMLHSRVFAIPTAQWLGYSSEQEFNHWLTQHDTIASRLLRQVKDMPPHTLPLNSVGFLPELDAAQLHACFSSDDAASFVAQPEWQGSPCETTSLSRQRHHPLVAQLINQYGNGVLTHLVARLVELATIPEILKQALSRIDSLTPPAENKHQQSPVGIGLGQVEAARGRLLHRLELAGDIVQRYQILAPTEWNFHPRGVAATLLKTLAANDETTLRQQADLVINCIDPCVQYEMTVH